MSARDASARGVVILGASSGIGRALAHELARRGDKLVLAARSSAALDEVVRECRERGAEAHAVATDVTDRVQLDALVAAAEEHLGGIDVWVGVAGVFGFGSVADTPDEVFDRIVEVNLLGQVHGVRAVLPGMLERGGGSIVIVGSVFSRVAAPLVSAYVASKQGLAGFADALRQELRDSGVTVSFVMPATVDTPIYQRAANLTGRRTHPLPPYVAPERVARVIARVTRRPRARVVVGRIQALSIPLQRLVRPITDRMTRGVIRLVGVREERADPTLGVLWEPDDASAAVSGGWKKRRVD